MYKHETDEDFIADGGWVMKFVVALWITTALLMIGFLIATVLIVAKLIQVLL